MVALKGERGVSPLCLECLSPGQPSREGAYARQSEEKAEKKRAHALLLFDSVQKAVR